MNGSRITLDTSEKEVLQYRDPTIPDELIKQCEKPNLSQNLGWGEAGYFRFRGLEACDEYPASYIGDALYTYPNFCPKPENGW